MLMNSYAFSSLLPVLCLLACLYSAVISQAVLIISIHETTSVSKGESCYTLVYEMTALTNTNNQNICWYNFSTFKNNLLHLEEENKE